MSGASSVEVEDLGHPGLGDVAEAGEFHHVGDLAGEQQAFEADRKGHETRDARNATGFNRWLLRLMRR